MEKLPTNPINGEEEDKHALDFICREKLNDNMDNPYDRNVNVTCMKNTSNSF